MKCQYDDKKIEGHLPFKCKFCQNYFCGDHRLPENHDCEGLRVYNNAKSKTYFKNVVGSKKEKNVNKTGDGERTYIGKHNFNSGKKKTTKYRFNNFKRKLGKLIKINGSIKWFVIWFLIHLISLYVLLKAVTQIGLGISFLNIIIMGLGITFISSIIRKYTKNRHSFFSDYFFWSFINLMAIWSGYILVGYFNFEELYYKIGILALSLLIFGKITTHFKLWKYKWIVVLVCIVGLYLYYSESIDLDQIYISNDIKEKSIFSELPNVCNKYTKCEVYSKNNEICKNNIINISEDYCGCPEGFRSKGETCYEILTCDDGTEYGTCSIEKPIYCNNGILINKSSICGCSINEVIYGESCISKFKVNSKKINMKYVLNGRDKSISFTVYKGLNDHLAGLDGSISYYTTPPTTKDFLMRDLNDKDSKEFLNEFVDKIKGMSNDKNTQARIAINLVQNIPYDYESFYSNDIQGKYPYEVLYKQIGVCGEKTKLLLYILRELGFGTAYLEFNNEDHAAVGIRCNNKYDYKDTGYCFVESTSPTIITDSYGEYLGAGSLSTYTDLIVVSEGHELKGVDEEYNDALRFKELNDNPNPYLSQREYNEWNSIVNKYGIEVEE